jgi:hypothetical protein
MKEQLREEYDLKSLKVRKMGEKRTSFGRTIVKLDSENKEKIKVIGEALKTQFNSVYEDRLSKLILFGSQARGDAGSFLSSGLKDRNDKIGIFFVLTNLSIAIRFSVHFNGLMLLALNFSSRWGWITLN